VHIISGRRQTCVENGGIQNSLSDNTVGTEGYKRKPGWPRKNWMDIVQSRTWVKGEEWATDRAE